MTGLFITGTDTGIGKTLVGCGLAAAWTAQGKRVGVLKPAETGCTERNGDWYPDDAVRLAGFAGQTTDEPEDWARLCPYRFPLPVAPSVAARLAGACIEPWRLVQRFSDVAERHDVTIVEGAGGLLVPLVGRYSFADLARDLAVPVLVVIGSKLGALNHALLTLDCLSSRGLPLAGYVLNHPNAESDDAVVTNAETLAGLTDVPCRGVIPHLASSGDLSRDRETLSTLFTAAVDLPGLLG